MCTDTQKDGLLLHQIGEVVSGFSSKFGIPRQSGLAESVPARIVLCGDFRQPDYVRGLKDFSHIWVLWGFSAAGEASPTVRPPRLGGNTRVGVFASRSPFRPNPIAMSCVRLMGISDGPVLEIAGADMLNGSPVYDVKPYIPSDCHPEAAVSFAGMPQKRLVVSDPTAALERVPDKVRVSVRELLSLDPRPAYHSDPSRIYGMEYCGFEVRFTVDGEIVTVHDIGEAGKL